MKKQNFSNYEALEWCMLHSESFPNLPIDVCIDESKHCAIYHNDLLFVYFRNSYNKEVNEFIPITVEEHPRLLVETKLNVFKNDLYDVFCFVSKYRKYIELISECKVDAQIIYDVASSIYCRNLNESSHPTFKLYEMAKIKKNLTGLSYDVWIDSGATYKLGGHNYRIKIEPTTHDSNTHNWNTLKMHDYEFIGDDVKKYSSSEKEAIKTWAYANSDLIIRASDENMDIGKFSYLQKPVIKDKNGYWTVIEPEKEDEYKPIFSIFNNMEVVMTEDKQHFNILDENGELLSDVWFSYISQKTFFDKFGEYTICNDEHKTYKLYSDAKLICTAEY